MLIYKNDGTLHCISKKALKLAGYSDVAQFLDEHDDYSELFVKRPGYIYNFENFSWLSFLRNANPEQKKVLIATRDNATYECELEMETLYPVTLEEGTPEFYIQIEFKNLHLSGEKPAAASFGAEPAAFAPSPADTDLDRELIDKAYETFEGGGLAEEPSQAEEQKEETPHVVFGGTPEPEAPAAESETEEETPLFGGFTEPEPAVEPAEEAPTVRFETPEPEPAAPSQPSFDQPLELVDFTLDEEEKEKPAPAAKEEEAPTLSIEEAFAGIGGPEPEAEQAETPEAEAPSFEAPAEERAEEAPEFGLMEEPATGAPAAETAAEAPAAPEEAPATEIETKPEAPAAAAPGMEMPDLRKVAATLGLPETMIRAFVKEFVDTYFDDVHEVELALASGNIHVAKKEAMKLKGIAGNLMMEPLVQTLESVLATRKNEEVRKTWRDIDAYLRALAANYAPERLAEAPAPSEQEAESAPETPTAEAPAAAEESAGTAKEATETAVPSAEPAAGRTLRLEERDLGETIVFDPAEAADALGLPESLIVEFVHDFVEQAREEKATFEKAFEAGDLTTVNETAHKLKGVAANLRIEEMRELMEKTQHAADFDEAEKNLTAFYHKLAALAKTMAKEFA